MFVSIYIGVYGLKGYVYDSLYLYTFVNMHARSCVYVYVCWYLLMEVSMHVCVEILRFYHRHA